MTFIPDKKQTDTRYPVLHPKLLFPSRRLKADTHEGFSPEACSRMILHVSVHTRERYLPRELAIFAPKYLTG